MASDSSRRYGKSCLPMKNQYNKNWTRRQFLKVSSLTTGALAFGVPTLLRGANLNSKLNIAVIGAGGKGSSDTACCAGENIVALCDVDKRRAAGPLAKYPGAKYFSDFRQMLDQMDKGIDAVNVSTPDHMHAIAAAQAMHRGKHVYCQKPLTHSIHEARELRELARRKSLVTQMGNQGSAEDGFRRGVEAIQSGIIGSVREVHVWTDRPIWPQGMDRPAGSNPVPEGLDWDLWLGAAPARPFVAKWPAEFNPKKEAVYHPFCWRGWQDFGCGALGDMGCHTVNLAYRALHLGLPTEVEAQPIGATNMEAFPIGATIRFQFPARTAKIPAAHPNWFHRHDTSVLAPVTLHWYEGGQPAPDSRLTHDGTNKPPRELTADIEAFRGEMPGSGCLILGERGQIFSPDDYGAQFFLKLAGDTKFIHADKHPALAEVPHSLPRNPFKGAADQRHHLEWINAIKDNKPEHCYSRFAIASELTEILLLGCVALRAGQKFKWDGPAMRTVGGPETSPFIRPAYRPGWTMH
jgi:Oxidoreductase family, NAD-binding Rossmann fold/Oxidoreductase family, C-terminal alpha/beta domain